MNSTGTDAALAGGGAHGPGHGCPSDLAIDAWLTGCADSAERRRIEAARVACDACRDHIAALERQRERFLDSAEAHHLETRLLARAREPEQETRRPFWRRWPTAIGAGALAAAAVAVALTVGPFGPSRDTPAPGGRAVVGLKGGPLHLEMFVQRDGAVLRLGVGESLRAGDAVGFRVTMSEPGWVAVFGTDQGRPVAIVPRVGDDALHVAAGAASRLPASAVLDAAGHEERFAFVSCPTAFPVGGARDALASWAQNGEDGSATLAVRRAIAPTCELRVLSFPKQ